MNEKIPLYKYKFKQIFNKIGQSKAYLNGESEKQTQLCQTVGPAG